MSAKCFILAMQLGIYVLHGNQSHRIKVINFKRTHFSNCYQNKFYVISKLASLNYRENIFRQKTEFYFYLRTAHEFISILRPPISNFWKIGKFWPKNRENREFLKKYWKIVKNGQKTEKIVNFYWWTKKRNRENTPGIVNCIKKSGIHAFPRQDGRSINTWFKSINWCRIFVFGMKKMKFFSNVLTQINSCPKYIYSVFVPIFVRLSISMRLITFQPLETIQSKHMLFNCDQAISKNNEMR